MVRITNGVNVFEVTRGAFDGIYSRQGYTIVTDKKTKGKGATPVVEVPELSADEQFCNELIEKPIGQWSKDDVKKFAEIKGIDIAGTKNANEAKERIKAFLEQ